MIYGIIQTPPGSTLEYTNSKAHELQAIAKGIEGVKSVSSLAGRRRHFSEWSPLSPAASGPMMSDV